MSGSGYTSELLEATLVESNSSNTNSKTSEHDMCYVTSK